MKARRTSWRKGSVSSAFKRRLTVIIYRRDLKGTADVISGGRIQFRTPLYFLAYPVCGGVVSGCSTPTSSVLWSIIACCCKNDIRFSTGLCCHLVHVSKQDNSQIEGSPLSNLRVVELLGSQDSRVFAPWDRPVFTFRYFFSLCCVGTIFSLSPKMETAILEKVEEHFFSRGTEKTIQIRPHCDLTSLGRWAPRCRFLCCHVWRETCVALVLSLCCFYKRNLCWRKALSRTSRIHGLNVLFYFGGC